MSSIQTLRKYLNDNSDFKKAFEKALHTALNLNIEEFAQFNVKTLDDYINFYEQMLSWTPTEDKTGLYIYNHLCFFYIVLDLPPVKKYQTPVTPTSPRPWSWLSQWLIDYSNELGNFMNSEASIDDTALATFYDLAPQDLWHMQDYPRVKWRTFNEFFARKIDPKVRPIEDPQNNTVIVSPADATFDGHWPVDTNANATVEFKAKGIPWSINQLLQDTVYGGKFAGGQFCHSFLAPWDYHRQHAPVSGKVVEAKVIPGLCYLEVVAKPDEQGNNRMSMLRGLRLPDDPGYQFIQARGLILIDNPDLGLVAVLPIGMCQIGSVVLSVKAGDVVKKGQEISYFQFGGSDIVMVFEAKANVSFKAKINEHHSYGEWVATGAPHRK